MTLRFNHGVPATEAKSGFSAQEIRAHLEEIYRIEVSPDLISALTDAALEDVAEWQGMENLVDISPVTAMALTAA